jgi:hypothetical protein
MLVEELEKVVRLSANIPVPLSMPMLAVRSSVPGKLTLKLMAWSWVTSHLPQP